MSITSVKAVPKALIVGDIRFLGSHLADSLLAQGCQVTVWVKDSSFSDLSKDKDLAHLIDNKNFSLVASPPGEAFNYGFFFGEEAWLSRKNFQVEKWLLFLSRPPKDKSVLKVSGGDNVRLAVARQVFGPRQGVSRGDLFFSWVESILSRREIVLEGDGSFKVYPLYVADLVKGLTAAMFMPHSQGQTFYFAGEEMTAFSFAKIWTDHWPEITIKFRPEKDFPSLDYLSLVEKTKDELVWKANTSQEKAVGATVSWLKSYHSSFISSSPVSFSPSSVAPKPKPVKTKKNKAKKEEPPLEVPVSFSLPIREKEEKTPQGDFFDLDRLKDSQIKEELQTKEKRRVAVFSSGKGKKKYFGKRRSWFTGLGVLVFFLALLFPVISLGVNAFLGVRSLKEGEEAFMKADFEKATSWSRKASRAFERANKSGERFDFFWQFILGDQQTDILSRYLEAGERGGLLLENIAHGSEKMAQAVRRVLSLDEGSPLPLLEEGENNLKEAYFALNDFLLLSQGLSLPSSFSSFGDSKEMVDHLEKAISFLSFWQDFLSQEKQTITVLFQNNMELRPTGGFIGSYGFLSFEKGRLTDFTVHDVYEADGQLHGHVEPPETLKKYLGESGWYLRDANWSPDFPTSAQQAAWFLEKEVKREVDGVWAINLNAVQKMLSALGGIYLPDYKEEINGNNLFERAEYYSEVGFFPGSTQKKDFLATLSFAILNEIKKNPSFGVKMATALQESLEEKDILFYFRDDSLEKKILSLGFGGSLKQATCQEKDCVADYLWLVEANVGANKANFFVKRKLAQRLNINDQKLEHTVRVSYENTAQSNTWPGGNYKNFLRFYLPEEALVKSIFIEDGSGKKKQVDQWEEERQEGKKIIGFIVEVPIKDVRVAELRYILRAGFSSSKRHLVFLYQKQGGMRFDDDITLISYPKDWLPLSVSPPQVVSGYTFSYHQFLNKGDRLIKISWGKS